MIYRYIAALLCLILLPTAAVRAEDAKEQLAKLQGEWKIVLMEKGGQSAPKSVTENIVVNFVGDKMILDGVLSGPEGAKPEKLEFTLSVDPTKTPKYFDTTALSGRYKGQTHPGIYILNGDDLKLGIPNQPTNDRPTVLKSLAGDTLVVMTLTRVVKK